MIGILLALQVNNWNENRKIKEKNYQLLHKVHEELEYNIFRSNGVLQIYRRKERDLSKVLNKEVTLEDYQTSRLAWLIFNYAPVLASDDDAKNLASFDINLNKKQDSLVFRITELYKRFKPILDAWDDNMGNYIKGLNDKLRDTKDWYYLQGLRKLNDEAYDYFLTDPFYLNEVWGYQMGGLGNHSRRTYQFNRDAKSIYLDLSDFLDLEIDTTLVGTPEMNGHYIGTYQYQDEFLEIKKDGNRLVCIQKNEGPETTDFYPDSDSTFVLNRYFGKLLKNDQNEITGMVLSLGTFKEPTEYSKIE